MGDDRNGLFVTVLTSIVGLIHNPADDRVWREAQVRADLMKHTTALCTRKD